MSVDNTLPSERVLPGEPDPGVPDGSERFADNSVVSRVRRRSFRRTWRRHKLGIIGLTMVAFIAITAVFGPIVLGIDPNHQSLTTRLLPLLSQGPDVFHLFGTDALGRDVLARVLAGSRASLGVVIAGLVLGAVIGILLGLLAGFYGKWVDNVVMRLVDAQLALPTLISAMFVAAVLGGGYWNTAITLGVTSWPLYARLIRAEVLRVREEDFTSAAVALGARDSRLLLRHIVPNLVGTISVVASLELGSLILTESSLSYLGFGLQPPDASWGSMISDGQAYVFTNPSLAIIPGLFIMISVLGLNFVGDWLRDVLGRQEVE
jgi:peptide/nickel transport system permease protein